MGEEQKAVNNGAHKEVEKEPKPISHEKEQEKPAHKEHDEPKQEAAKPKQVNPDTVLKDSGFHSSNQYHRCSTTCLIGKLPTREDRKGNPHVQKVHRQLCGTKQDSDTHYRMQVETIASPPKPDKVNTALRNDILPQKFAKKFHAQALHNLSL